MGNSQSPPADPHLASATRAFTPKELEDLKSLFVSLAAQSHGNSHYISLSIFQACFGVKGVLGERLFDLVTQERKDGRLTFEDLVIAKSVYEKGSRDEIDEFIYQLVDVTGDGIVGRVDLESVLSGIFDLVLSSKDCIPELSSCQDWVNVFLGAATFSKDVEKNSGKGMSIEDLRNWFAFVPSVRKVLGSLLILPTSGRPGFQVPQLVQEERDVANKLLLRKEFAWHIGGILSQQELEEWKLLYHSDVNGLSFNTFLGSISNAEGPTVLIVKDKEGCIYGGYASQPWERHADFYGDMRTFLFQLYPKASIFKPTGANTNLQWCAVNFSSESIPNGIGFGGRVNHFGLFLSASFDQGHTFACTTFGSPCLSISNRISPEVIECWGIVHKGSQQEKQDSVKGTVLERFKEDRNMLKMVGIANSSD